MERIETRTMLTNHQSFDHCQKNEIVNYALRKWLISKLIGEAVGPDMLKIANKAKLFE